MYKSSKYQLNYTLVQLVFEMGLLPFLCFVLCTQSLISAALPPSCSSEIYCHGELLHDIQMSNLYKDSKTFVDLRLKGTPDEVLQAFTQLKQNHGGQLNNDDIKTFVEQNFLEGDELEVWSPPDYTETPSIAAKVVDTNIRNWTLQLNGIWKTLSRKIKEDVKVNPTHYSLIYIPNGFVIPGGRFRELYYWDTYWIVKGLMLCDMQQTAKGVIENLLHLVNVIGHMPNGNRVYYVERSQPPLLTQMVDHYFLETGDKEFLRAAYPSLKKEMEWWLKNRSLRLGYKGKKYLLFRYFAPSEGPRPESYREDVATVSSCQDETCKTQKYISLKSGAESGWDFSSRWFIKDGTNNGNLSDIETGNIIPVDLNAFIHRNLMILRLYGLILGDKSYKKYESLARELQNSIDDVLYDKKQGIWFDFDAKNMKSRKYFYLSNFAPLWTKSYDLFKKSEISKRVMKYIKDVGLEQFPGGSPTSLMETGQQWDMPNAWPPLQAILVYGLDGLGTPDAKELAKKLANTWVLSNYKAFAASSHMYEKYNSNVSGGAGGGGEYDVQAGFGWTNGVILEMINSWPTISTA